MIWCWQRPDWPNFTWDPARLRQAEARFLVGGGVFMGTVRHLGAADQDELTVEAISTEAVTTSAIEGETLDRASVQASIRRQLGRAADPRRGRAAEEGIAQMMVELYRHFAEPLSDEMAQFNDWFNRTAPDGADPLPVLTRAGLAHFYFVCIRPFEDGNGRIGRSVAEKTLFQGLARPALAATILLKRKAYYEALARSNTALELTDWLAWYAVTTREAQLRTTAQVEFLLDKTSLLDRLAGRLNGRQQ